jgi:hypothetical protein
VNAPRYRVARRYAGSPVRWLDAHGLWTETETEAGAWARDVALVNLDRNSGWEYPPDAPPERIRRGTG